MSRKQKLLTETPNDVTFFMQDWLLERPRLSRGKTIQLETQVEKFSNQAKFMRNLRKVLQKTQVEMGQDLGFADANVARQTISDVERGIRGLPVEAAAKLQKHDVMNYMKAYLADQKSILIDSLLKAGADIGSGK